MSHLPSHPATNEEPNEADGRQRPGPQPVARILVIGLVVLVLAGMIVLHLTGVVGPGSH